MFFIEKISKNVVSIIWGNSIVNEDEKEIMEYGALICILQIMGVCAVMIFGSIFGILVQALVFYFTTCILRKYSGGVHSDSPNRCMIVGTFVSTFIPLCINRIFKFFPFNLVVFLEIIILIFCYYTILKLAPVDSVSKPIVNDTFKKQLKIKSILTMLIMTILILVLMSLYIRYNYILLLQISQCICFACLWQCYTLTQFGHKIMSKIDNI
ncbi:MAG: accessory gene regulator B family protein [Clostridium sp.]|uniref:accessory gene regulator ArgB-like protein n=1 Tax=Clostridium sp. TaxID=1506 RepID=UPI0039ED628D